MLRRSYTWCTLILAQTNHRNTYWNCDWDGTPSRPLSWPWLRRWSGEPSKAAARKTQDGWPVGLRDIARYCEMLMRYIGFLWSYGFLDGYGSRFWKYQHISALLFAWDIFGSFLKTWLCALTLCHLKIFCKSKGWLGPQDLQGLALATNRYQAHLVLKCAKLI